MSFCKLLTSGVTGSGWMEEALRQALQGLGATHPNPPVGCVVVKNNQLIAKGFHTKAGELHAEAKALQIAGLEARGATLYVTLEPCNHFGRTPPCTKAIIQAGIQKVVYAVKDPNPHVTGQGALELQKAGIEVESVYHPEAEALIGPFATFVQKGRPFVLAKMAVSLDGKIAFQKGEQTSITGPEVKELVHQMREGCDAIVVGSQTVLIDDPQLNCRFENRSAKRHPARIVLDSRLRTRPSHQVYRSDGTPRFVVHDPEMPESDLAPFKAAGVHCLGIPKAEVMQGLAKLGMTSLMLEGGGEAFTSFLQKAWIDEIAWFTSPIFLGNQGVAVVNALKEPVSFKKCESFQLPSGPNSVKKPAWLILSAY